MNLSYLDVSLKNRANRGSLPAAILSQCKICFNTPDD